MQYCNNTSINENTLKYQTYRIRTGDEKTQPNTCY